MCHQVFNEKTWKAFEGEAMDARAKALLDGPDRAFDLTDVAVGGNDVCMNRKEVGSDAFEFMIAVEIGDMETPVCIVADHGLE
jgi:hypothetical protein